MRRKLFSALFLVTALSIALGAFGHGHQWSKHVLPVMAGLDPGMIRLLALVWFWVSATMLVFGFLLIWTWWRIGRGERSEEHTSELQSRGHLVCRLLLEKKKNVAYAHVARRL